LRILFTGQPQWQPPCVTAAVRPTLVARQATNSIRMGALPPTAESSNAYCDSGSGRADSSWQVATESPGSGGRFSRILRKVSAKASNSRTWLSMRRRSSPTYAFEFCPVRRSTLLAGDGSADGARSSVSIATSAQQLVCAPVGQSRHSTPLHDFCAFSIHADQTALVEVGLRLKGDNLTL